MDTPITLLIAEDDPVLQDLYKTQFEAAGMLVLQAFDGQQAVEMLGQHPETSMALLDIMMPKLSGYDVLARIKHDQQWRGLPIIMVSALADIDDQARALQLGASDYITKGDMLPSAVVEKIKHYAISIQRPAQQ